MHKVHAVAMHSDKYPVETWYGHCGIPVTSPAAPLYSSVAVLR